MGTSSTALLTDKQARFADEYLIDSNATRAAIRAGFSVKTANEQGARLLKTPKVAKAIAEGQREIAARVEVTAERIRQELSKLAFTNMATFVTISPAGEPIIDLAAVKDDPVALAAIAEVSCETSVEGHGEEARIVRKIRVKLHDKLSALDKLARHLGMFNTPYEPPDPFDWSHITDEELETVGRIMEKARPAVAGKAIAPAQPS